MPSLTDKEITAAIRKAKITAADVYLTDEGRARGVGRLRVRARPTGQVLFYFRYTNPAGQQQQIPLGVYNPTGRDGLTLRTARVRAGDLSLRYQRGEHDLRAHLEHDGAERMAQLEKAKRAREEAERLDKSGTLRALLDGYADHLEARGKVSAKQARTLFKKNVLDAKPELAQMRASAIAHQDINALLATLVEKGKGRTASKLRAYLRAAYSLALQAGSDPTVPSSLHGFHLSANPVAAIPAKALAAFNRVRERTLNVSELKTYMMALDALPEGMTRDSLWLALLLGGQRPAQLVRVTSSDIDFDGLTITLHDAKGARTQARVHRLPLASRAAAIVQRVHETIARTYDGESPVIFTNNGKVPVRVETLSATVAEICKGMIAKKTAREAFELRDVRRTCETMLAGMGVSRDVRAQILSHGLGGVQQRHYDRHDYMAEKLAALTAWDARLQEIAEGTTAGNVVDLPRRATTNAH